MNSPLENHQSLQVIFHERIHEFFNYGSVFQHLLFLKKWRKLITGDTSADLPLPELLIRHRQLTLLIEDTYKYIQYRSLMPEEHNKAQSKAFLAVEAILAVEGGKERLTSNSFEWLLEAVESDAPLTKQETKHFYKACKKLIIACNELDRVNVHTDPDNWF